MVCVRNISINTLHRGYDDDEEEEEEDDDNSPSRARP